MPVVAALAIVVASVARTNAEAVTATPDTTESGQPVSSALVTGEVAGSDLLSLLLNSTADATLATTPSTGGGL